MGEIFTKPFFSLKVSHILLSYAFLYFGKIFGDIQRELLFIVQKLTISEEHLNTQKFFFLKMFEKGQILRKNWICLNNFF